MKQLVFKQTGKPAAVLEISEDDLSLPLLATGEVRVKILAAPINPADLNLIEGSYGVKATLPATAGGEGCGVVELSNSSEFVTGNMVMFLNRAATWVSHLTVRNEELFKLPLEIDPLQAAMLKVNPATAWQLLHSGGELNKGDVIVQNAGNSAVGRCVIQLARDLGIRTISFVRRAEVCEELRALGADHVLLDDDTGLAAARDILGGATAALAFNAVGGDSALRLMKLLRQGGSHLTYGAMGRKPVTIPNGLLIFRDLQIRGLWISRWIETAPPAEVREVYTNLAVRVAAGTLVQAVDSTYSLEDFQCALARLEAPGRTGKVLFVP
jgi:mitochondrial enoyl-[acyl-carrier protein] reductase / trans-2-enoyl-CoA reductase